MAEGDNPLMTETEELRARAAAIARNAYAPYSGLYVGAALRTASGRIHAACNVENGALPIGACAERAAISAAVSAEGESFGLAAIAIVATTRDGTPLPVSPCGACRQALVEFSETAPVGFLGPDGHWIQTTTGELLPFRFVLPPDRGV